MYYSERNQLYGLFCSHCRFPASTKHGIIKFRWSSMRLIRLPSINSLETLLLNELWKTASLRARTDLRRTRTYADGFRFLFCRIVRNRCFLSCRCRIRGAELSPRANGESTKRKRWSIFNRPRFWWNGPRYSGVGRKGEFVSRQGWIKGHGVNSLLGGDIFVKIGTPR